MADEEVGILLTLRDKQQLLSGLDQVRSQIKGMGQDTSKSSEQATVATSRWQRLQGRVDAFSGSTARARKVSGALFGVLVANSQGALGPIQDVQNKLMGVGQALEDTRSKAGKWAIGFGAALTGAGAVLGTIYSKEEAAQHQLDSAITGAGGNVLDFQNKISSAVKTGEHYGNTAARTMSALNRLVLASHDPAKAFQAYNSVLQLSAARHIDVEQSALMVGRAINGYGRSLLAFGIKVTPTQKLETALTSAQKRHATAIDQVKKAQQSLNDEELRINATHQNTTGNAIKLASAHMAVESATVALSKAEQKYGAGSGNAILAQQRLSLAQQRYSQVVQASGASGKMTLAQQISLRNAQQRLASAQEKVISSTKDQTKAQNELHAAGSNVDQLNRQVSKYMGGQASAAANTFTGHLHAIAAVIDDKLAGAGEHATKWLTTFGPAMMGLGAILETGVIGKFAKGTKALVLWSDESKIASGVTKVWTGVQAAWNLVMDANPIMLAVIALVLLGAVFIIAWKKSKTFRDFVVRVGHDISAAFKAVWTWIKSNWPLLLDILLGPFGYVLGWVIKNWHKVVEFFAGIIGWFKSNWEYLLLPLLLGPFGFVVAWVFKHWDQTVDFFKKLPGRIGAAFKAVGGFIVAPFKWAFNMIARGWNDTAGKLSFHLPGWIPGIGGDGFSMPTIPYWGETDQGVSTTGTSANFSAGAAEAMGHFHTGGYVPFDMFANIQPGEEIVHLPGGTTVVPVDNSGLIGALSGQQQGDTIIPVSVEIDGKEVAKATFKHTRDRAARL